ncbi:MAG TPA: SGNH/GDSL hydrolase family protein [Terriglobia bacterium]|nr:SGNH/GDSL hydrolase family protein [Terriglobia bacterium]
MSHGTSVRNALRRLPARLAAPFLGPLLGILTVIAWAPGASCQITDDFKPPQATCCLQMFAQRLADQLQDWNQLGRYHADDLRLMSAPAEAHRVVFLGDSITDGWNLAQFFPGKPYVNRGISGQTTPQMLVRMFPDVIDLKPEALIILAGTNDIARNTGPETLTMIEENFQAIAELAQAHGVKAILCLLTPVSDYTLGHDNQANRQTEHRPPADILKVNAWLRDYASAHHLGVADYYSALVDDKGMLRSGYSDDGLHPNAKGYGLLAPVAEAAIEKALH